MVETTRFRTTLCRLLCPRDRVILTAEADVEGHKVDEVLTELIRSVEVPRT